MAERNTWKMPFTEIRPLVSLLNADAKTRIIRMRFMLLAEFKFLKLTLSDDENHIVDVEIPVLISNNLSEAFDA